MSVNPGEAAAIVDVRERMYDSTKVCNFIAVSKRTLWRMIRAGQFPQPTRFNRKLVRWLASDINAWMKGQAKTEPSLPFPAPGTPNA